jgi:uncharacterized protein
MIDGRHMLPEGGRRLTVDAVERQRMAPVDAGERLSHLDVLRGFALLGILLVNFEYFTRPTLAIMLGAEPGLTGADHVVDLAIRTFAEGKFFPLFSMLFGAGFVLFWERVETRGGAARRPYLRRLAVLAVFGLLHGTLVWAGDILFIYAVLGFVMALLFRNVASTAQLAWAVLLVVLPSLLYWLFVAAFEAARTDPEAFAAFQRDIDAQHADLEGRIAAAEMAYRDGRWIDAVAQTRQDFAFFLSQSLFWVTPVLGYFLLGRWLLETGRLREPIRHAAFFERLAVLGLPIGAASSIAATFLVHGRPFYVPSPALALGVTLMSVGAPLLVLGYVALVVRWQSALWWLAPAGRLALTNYLVQSLVWTAVFYGYGLGLWGSVPRAVHPILVVGFFALQVAFSHWWIARFRFGPAEWLWRSLTYLEFQPMRRHGDMS